MQVSSGTLLALYHGVFLYIFVLINYASRMPQVIKLLASAPALLFVSFFPYTLEADLFLKFLLTIIGFFSSFNIVDLVYLEPVDSMSFKDYMFYLSTSSRAESAIRVKPASTEGSIISALNSKGLIRLVKAAIKFAILSTIFENIQTWEFPTTNHFKYYTFMYLVGLCLYLCFNVLLDTVGLFWEVVYGMKPKELFRTPFMASSPRDFWSKRWNMFFRDFFHKIFYKNYKSISYLRSVLSALAIFAISGVLHEYVYWSIMGKLSGLNFMFFMVHGLATTLQVIIQTMFPALRRIPVAVAIPINSVFLALTMPLFIDPYIQSGFITQVKIPFSLMPTLSAAVSEVSGLYA